MFNRFSVNSTVHRKWAVFILGVTLLFVAIRWFGAYNQSGLRNPDSFDYAQMGRELTRGNGFSTRQLLPRHLTYLSERNLLNENPIPNLYRYPGIVVAHAIFQLCIDDLEKAGMAQ